MCMFHFTAVPKSLSLSLFSFWSLFYAIMTALHGKDDALMNTAVFMNWILKQLDLKKKERLISASKTDLYSDGDMTAFCEWIDNIKSKIKEFPPVGYASQIILNQDNNGSLINVRYVYSASADIPSFIAQNHHLEVSSSQTARTVMFSKKRMDVFISDLLSIKDY